MGSIPELKSPTYAELRNRICEDGTEWLGKEVKEFYSSKLYESNTEYSALKKFVVNIKNKKSIRKTIRYLYKFVYLFSYGKQRKILKKKYKSIK